MRALGPIMPIVILLMSPAVADIGPTVNRAHKADRLRTDIHLVCVALAPSASAVPECIDLSSFVGFAR